MKFNKMKFLILSLAILLTSRIKAQNELVEYVTFGTNPGNLKMYMYEPEIDSNNTKRPLVIALHGCSQQPEYFAQQTGWNDLADKFGFYILYPAQKAVNNASLCFNWFNNEDIEKGKGEVGSIKTMLTYAIKKFNIDTTQIFVYGLSAGAAMGVSLMAVYPDDFKAGASFAGLPYKAANNINEAVKILTKGSVIKTPKEWGELVKTDSIKHRYPKLIVGHGTADYIVNIQNSEELIKQWCDLHHIDELPDSIVYEYESPWVTRISYKDQNGDEKIIFYKFSHLGHAVPVDPGPRLPHGGKKGMFSKDIDFFSTYYIAKEFGIAK